MKPLKLIGMRRGTIIAILAMAGLMAIWASPVAAQIAPCEPDACENEMAIDADASDGDVDASATYAIDPGDDSAAFDITVNITDVDTDYGGFSTLLEWDTAIIAPILSGDPAKETVEFLHLGGMSLGTGPPICADTTGTKRACEFGEAMAPGTTVPINATGAAAKMTFKCVAAGSSDLRLVPYTLDPAAANSSTLTLGAGIIPTGLTKGVVNCQPQADLRVSKTHSPENPVAGGQFTVTITVDNDGPNAAKSVYVSDSFEAGKTYESDTAPLGCVPFSGVEDTLMCPLTSPYGENSDQVTAPDPTVWRDYTSCFNGEDDDRDGNEDGTSATPGEGTCGDDIENDDPADGIDGDDPDCQAFIDAGDTDCAYSLFPAGTHVEFDIVFNVPLDDAGKTNGNSVTVQSVDGVTLFPVTKDPNLIPILGIWGSDDFYICLLDGRLGAPNPYDPPADMCDNAWGDEIDVAAAHVTISKEADSVAPYSEGDSITWTLTVTSDGDSPASNVVITDTVGDNQSIDTAALTGDAATAYDCDETSSDDFEVVGQVAECTLDDGTNPPEETEVPATPVITAEIVTEVTGSVDTTCTDTADVCWADPTCASDTQEEAVETVLCFPPTVRMQKDVTDDPLDVVDEANLWLCEGDTCVNNGEGQLVIVERVFNVDNDPDGAGAYEFQLKFDHKIFDITIEDSSWLSKGANGVSGGGDDRDVQCNMTVITENWILFGCVSTGGPGHELGNTSDGIIATITVDPEPDLKYRLTPGNDNGIVRVLLDENCEIADPLGHPLEIEGWADDGIDNDGDTVVDEFGEGLAPGVVTGGIIEECSDFGITVRILEGDLNLDCEVDVNDQQAIAYRYGASFGMMLYDPWYDLEPSFKDFDIDIKDLQKVFGRDGSTCAAPIPPQPPVDFE